MRHRWRSLVRDKGGEIITCPDCDKVVFLDRRQSNKLHRWFREGTRWPQITVSREGECASTRRRS
jgi:uncharacterized C2H2 Zn-finger protein